MTDTRIVTSTYRYKRPPRKRMAVPLEGPAIVRRGRERDEVSRDTTLPEPANGDRKPAIVTVKRRPGRFGDAPDLTPDGDQGSSVGLLTACSV